jgi:hypothetical protein
VTPPPKEPVLASADIQGNVLPGFNTRHQTLLGLRFDGDPRAWLASVLPFVSTLADVHGYRLVRRQARLHGEAPAAIPVWVNIAFAAKGLAALGSDVERIRDQRFRQGMGGTSNLGDPRDRSHPGHPSRWVVGGTPERTPDALVIVASDDAAGVRDRVAQVREGRTVIYEQEGHGLDGEIEHFGFRDGISSVGVRGRLDRASDSHLTRRTIDSNRFGRPGQPLMWPGQFVFGYPRQRSDDPGQARPGEHGRSRLDEERLVPGLPPAPPGRGRLPPVRRVGVGAAARRGEDADDTGAAGSTAGGPLAGGDGAHAQRRWRRSRPDGRPRHRQRLRLRRRPLRARLPELRPHPQGQPARPLHRQGRARPHPHLRRAPPRLASPP